MTENSIFGITEYLYFSHMASMAEKANTQLKRDRSEMGLPLPQPWSRITEVGGQDLDMKDRTDMDHKRRGKLLGMGEKESVLRNSH